MSVTAPLGFRAAGVAAGIKSGGHRDVAVVINDGPQRSAAAVFTRNRVKAAPVLWSQQVVAGGRVRAAVLNSGGANACTGAGGFQDTHATAEHLAAALDDSDAGPRVTEFMVPPVDFDAESTGGQVLEAFTGDTALNSVVLIDHQDKPIGVIDRTRFLLSVTGRYGHALHAKRPALRLAESPRTVPAWTSAIAALRVAGQDRERVYDDLIVTNPYGQCLGVVHVSDLIQSLSRR